MAINLGEAYVDIVPSTRGLADSLRRDVEQPVAESGTRAGAGFGSRFVEGWTSWSGRVVGSIADTVSTGVAGAATVATGVLASTFAMGFGRFTGLENAERMLQQMGLSAQQSKGLMDSLLDSLLDTPFALDEGAGAIASFVATGADLDEIPTLMGQVVDAAGFSHAPLGEVAALWQRILLNGRATNYELRMLTNRNIPAYTLLADTLGITADELSNMAMSGELTADIFFEAWEEGAQGFGENNIRMAGAAKAMGDTTSGALSNLRAAMARFGEKAFGPIFEAIRPLADSLRGTFDALAPQVQAMVEAVVESDVFQRFLGFMEDLPDKVGPAIDKLRELGIWLGPLAGLFASFGLAGLRSLPLIGGLVPVISPLLGVFLGLVAASPELREALQRIGEALLPVIEAIGEKMVEAVQWAEPILVSLFEWMADNATPVAAALGVVIGGILVGAVVKLGLALWALATNPVVLIIGALALLAIAVTWAYQNVDWFRGLVIIVAKFFGSQFKTAVDAAIGVVNFLTAAFWVAKAAVDAYLESMRELARQLKMGWNIGRLGLDILLPGRMMFRADGGPVTAGQPYIVGEEGPELFIPGRSGQIIPNHSLADIAAPAAGGGVTIENIDARGTDDPLAMADQLRRLLAWEMTNAGVVG